MVKFEDFKMRGSTLSELIDALCRIRDSDGFDNKSFVEVIDDDIYVNRFGEDGSVIIEVDESRVYDLLKVQNENLEKSMEKAKRRADVIASGVQDIRKCTRCGVDITHLINKNDHLCEDCREAVY